MDALGLIERESRKLARILSSTLTAKLSLKISSIIPFLNLIFFQPEFSLPTQLRLQSFELPRGILVLITKWGPWSMQSGQSLPRSVVKRYELMVVVLRKFFITVMGVIFIVLLQSLFSFGLGLYKKHHQMNPHNVPITPIYFPSSPT